MTKRNETCPSYDCEECQTYPSHASVKCGGEETKNCKWLDFDFKKTSFSEYLKQEKQKGRK